MFGAAFIIIIKNLKMLEHLSVDICSIIADMLVLCHYPEEENLECFNILEEAVKPNKELQ